MEKNKKILLKNVRKTQEKIFGKTEEKAEKMKKPFQKYGNKNIVTNPVYFYFIIDFRSRICRKIKVLAIKKNTVFS